MKNNNATPNHRFGTMAAVMLVTAWFQASPVMAQQEAPGIESGEAADAESAEVARSPGMSMPLDGSSVEAFEKRMKEIEAETTVAEFTTLQNAIDYLLVYDLAARRDRELLYQRLDGKTPNDVLGMVKWRLEGRHPTDDDPKVNEPGVEEPEVDESDVDESEVEESEAI